MSKSPEGRDRIPDEEDTAEVPLTMAASVILTNLPRDATKALESAGDLGMQKSMYFREGSLA
jgi:ubiquitin-like protein ATG12